MTMPSEIYYRSRRNALIISSLLLLAIYIGISVEAPTNAGISLKDFIGLPIKLDNLNFLPRLFFFVVLCMAWQFFAAWWIQTEEAREYIVNKLDCVFVGAFIIGASVSHFYIYPTRMFWGLSAFLLFVWFLFFGLGVYRWKRVINKNNKVKESKLERTLSESKWSLLYNPILNRSKNISFNDDGSIGDGKNPNETWWRIKNELLEILNSNRELYSQFRYKNGQFEHTNSPDTLSKLNQVIKERTSEN